MSSTVPPVVYNVSFLFKCKVQQLALNVCASHFYANRITQLVDIVTAASHETIVLFVKLIIVVVEVAHRYKTLTVIVVNLTIYAIALYTAYMGIIHFANLVGHKLHHFIFNRVSLSILSHLLHIATVFAKLFAVVFVH